MKIVAMFACCVVECAAVDLTSLLAVKTLAKQPVPASLIPESGKIGSACDFVTGSLSFSCVPIYVAYLIKLMLALAGGFFLFGIMIAGYKYMFGSITQAGMESGKKEIVARIIGFSVIVLSYLIIDTIVRILTS